MTILALLRRFVLLPRYLFIKTMVHAQEKKGIHENLMCFKGSEVTHLVIQDFVIH